MIPMLTFRELIALLWEILTYPFPKRKGNQK